MSNQVILIGHSTGGMLARQYLLKYPDFGYQVSYVFALGSPHRQTHFSYQVYVPSQDAHHAEASMVRTPEISQSTFIINIMGDGAGQGYDGVVNGVLLPEAVNITFPLRHAELKYAPEVFEEILACIRGKRFRMQFYLQSMTMQDPDEDGFVGPFHFEVNDMRVPFDGVFAAEADHLYTFDENSTPLATIAYSPEEQFVATAFQLKDRSHTSLRRRLVVKLMDPLKEDVTTIHELQDNKGSKITLRVHTQRFPNILTYGI